MEDKFRPLTSVVIVNSEHDVSLVNVESEDIQSRSDPPLPKELREYEERILKQMEIDDQDNEEDYPEDYEEPIEEEE